MTKKRILEAVLLLLALFVVLTIKSLLAKNWKSIEVIENSPETTQYTVAFTDQLDTVVFQRLEKATKDSGSDSEVLFYLTDSLNIIQTESKSFIRRQIISNYELPRKANSMIHREKTVFL